MVGNGTPHDRPTGIGDWCICDEACYNVLCYLTETQSMICVENIALDLIDWVTSIVHWKDGAMDHGTVVTVSATSKKTGN